MRKQSDWITASEVASFVYCPESWRLEHAVKSKPTKKSQLARDKGEVEHQSWQTVEKRSGTFLRVAAVLFVIALALWVLSSVLESLS